MENGFCGVMVQIFEDGSPSTNWDAFMKVYELDTFIGPVWQKSLGQVILSNIFYLSKEIDEIRWMFRFF